MTGTVQSDSRVPSISWKTDFPRLDALFNGTHEALPVPMPGMKLRNRIKTRPQKERIIDSKAARKSVEQRFLDLVKCTRCNLFSGSSNAHTGLPERGLSGYGATTGRYYTPESKRKITIMLCIEFLQPLLRSDLTDTEM